MSSTRGPLRGIVAAALTPLQDAGESLDEAAVGPLVDFYIEAGVDGIFVAGTTGESLLLTLDERTRLLEAVIAAADRRTAVAVHVGAQSTAATVRLAGQAAELGADCVAVAPPPFFGLDDAALFHHLLAAAQACAPLPFYLYEIRQRTGYAIPLSVVHRLQDSAANLVGMKVSDPTLEDVQRYLLPGFDVMVGAEALVRQGLDMGAVGAVSGLAGALPRHVVNAIREPSTRAVGLGALRAGLERFPFHAAAKRAVIAQNVCIRQDVRAPLRQLTSEERTDLEDWLATGVLVDARARALRD
jgi:dihydrodipicolinate synthase/N-acetylneuraminate lyase